MPNICDLYTTVLHPLQSMCLWQQWGGGTLRVTWCLVYSAPKACGKDPSPHAPFPFGHLSYHCNDTLAWGNQIIHWFNSSQVRQVCAPAGQDFICGLRTNPLPYDGHIQPSSPYPGKAIALKCLDNAWCKGQCTLGIMQNSSVGVTIYQAIQPRSKRATGLILAGIGAAIGLAAPWGGFIYHAATVSNLSDILYDLSQV